MPPGANAGLLNTPTTPFPLYTGNTLFGILILLRFFGY
jgi:hypothetical protein